MVPAPSCPNTWDYWMSPQSDCVELTCLLPNSMYIPLRKSWDATFEDVKEDLWDRAVNYPLFGMLLEMNKYIFQFVNSLAVTEELDDERKRICDIKPVCGVLIIVKRSDGRPAEDCLNRDITHLIGKSLKVFDSLKNSEVNDYRMRMRYLAEESLLKRTHSTTLERLRYQCPLRLADQPEIPTTLKSHLNDQRFILVTKVMEITSYSSNVPATLTPQQHIEIVLRKLNNSMNLRSEHPHNYVLKVCGREEYLFGDYPLIQFLYIQEMLAVDGVPQVMTVSIDKLRLSLDREIPYMPERRRLTSEHSNTMRRKKNESSWNIQKNYTCRVQSACGLNVDPSRVVEVVCLGGIFHGGKPLCEVQKTKVAVISKEGVATWEEELTFPIKVHNLPRMARLCFGIYELSKIKSKWRGKDKEPVNRLTWANTMVFDYKEQLRTDGVRLAMWTHVADDTQGDDMVLHPLGTVVANPTPDSAVLQVMFSNYDCQYPILFPKQETVMAYSDHIESVSPDLMDRLCRDFERLRIIAEKDPMYEMHEQEKKDIWASRME